MTEVTRDQFYAVIGPLDVHPRPMREHTDWYDQRANSIIGRSTPGYTAPGTPGRYYLIARLAPAPTAPATDPATPPEPFTGQRDTPGPERWGPRGYGRN